MGKRNGESWQIGDRCIRQNQADLRKRYHLNSTGIVGFYRVYTPATIRQFGAEIFSFTTSFVDRPACGRSGLSIEEIYGLLDLVLYDIPNRNPFRQLIAIAYKQPILMETIVANSALHMSNTYQRLPQSSVMSAMIVSTQRSTSLRRSLLTERCGPDLPEIIHDALMAKQQALGMLQSALEDMATVNVDLILAVVLLLISCELIDSGQGNWMFHISGARVIIEKLIATAMATETAWSPLCSSLISNCLV
ncbi:hypothetical protein CTAM01_11686 [Colletotrichum tamarilloi]|uniref:Uncharacterized protein n=1 Tax=Colletotrichum tamarilloi TaxID=1209934 RepID=A0ABQ9QWN5_9PEZI|nr:uncharacterized protein CTAM01_11686 [Colletotrichum tamarilloi]KAK1487653.1 hypothetical protein CTAM01_11686 [Colletotrichum tamarilloi]